MSMSMTKTIELYVSLIVPQNILNLCCATGTSQKYSGASAPGVPYKLNQTDPVRFQQVLNIIQTTPASAYIWEDRDEVKLLRKALKKWNIEHPNDMITEEEIIRSANAVNYKHSKIGEDGKYKGIEMHEFADIDNWNFTHGTTKYKIYLKFVTPGDGTLDILSFHRDKDLDKEEAALYDWYYTDEGL